MTTIEAGQASDFLSDDFFSIARATLPGQNTADIDADADDWSVGYATKPGDAPAHVQVFRACRLVEWHRGDDASTAEPDVMVWRPPEVDHGDFAGTMPAEGILAASKIGPRDVDDLALDLPDGLSLIEAGGGAHVGGGGEPSDLLGLDLALTYRGIDCVGDAATAGFRLVSTPFGEADVTVDIDNGRCRRWHLGQAKTTPDLSIRCSLMDFIVWLHGDGIAGHLMMRGTMTGAIELVSYVRGSLFPTADEPIGQRNAVALYLQCRQISAPIIDAVMDQAGVAAGA